MNREIKFRAWDKSTNEMVDWEGITGHGNTMYVILCKTKSDKYDLMQYTGLKDKNGKEIYEGDIVRLSDDYRFHEGELCVIEWHKYSVPYIVQRYLVSRLKIGDYNFDYIKGDSELYEIIGNIYSHPSLLTNK